MSHGRQGRVSFADVDATTAEAVAEAMQALATPSRVRLLARLCDGPCSVGVLAASVGLEQSLRFASAQAVAPPWPGSPRA